MSKVWAYYLGTINGSIGAGLEPLRDPFSRSLEPGHSEPDTGAAFPLPESGDLLLSDPGLQAPVRLGASRPQSPGRGTPEVGADFGLRLRLSPGHQARGLGSLFPGCRPPEGASIRSFGWDLGG